MTTRISFTPIRQIANYLNEAPRWQKITLLALGALVIFQFLRSRKNTHSHHTYNHQPVNKFDSNKNNGMVDKLGTGIQFNAFHDCGLKAAGLKPASLGFQFIDNNIAYFAALLLEEEAKLTELMTADDWKNETVQKQTIYPIMQAAFALGYSVLGEMKSLKGEIPKEYFNILTHTLDLYHKIRSAGTSSRLVDPTYTRLFYESTIANELYNYLVDAIPPKMRDRLNYKKDEGRISYSAGIAAAKTLKELVGWNIDYPQYEYLGKTITVLDITNCKSSIKYGWDENNLLFIAIRVYDASDNPNMVLLKQNEKDHWYQAPVEGQDKNPMFFLDPQNPNEKGFFMNPQGEIDEDQQENFIKLKTLMEKLTSTDRNNNEWTRG